MCTTGERKKMKPTANTLAVFENATLNREEFHPQPGDIHVCFYGLFLTFEYFVNTMLCVGHKMLLSA